MHAGLPELAVHRRSTAWLALFGPWARCRYSELDDPYFRVCAKTILHKKIFPNFLSGRRPSSKHHGITRRRVGLWSNDGEYQRLLQMLAEIGDSCGSGDIAGRCPEQPAQVVAIGEREMRNWTRRLLCNSGLRPQLSTEGALETSDGAFAY